MKPSETQAGPAPARSVLRYSRQAKFCKTHGKPGYRTRRKAQRAAESQRSVGVSLAVYRCKNCNLFHVTSNVKRAKAERVRSAA